jgi:SAM-dependent methyltransferase
MLRDEKATVRDFYETFGWSTDSTGTYKGTAAFVDLRPILSSYYRKTLTRVAKFLKPSGEYFLDAGSGTLSEPEYFLYSANYTRRVCLDLSERALTEARRKLKTDGLYVIGDLTNLPFREGTFDTVLASHVLYHVPEDEQAGAVRELYRTLKSDGTCVIIYIWPTSLVAKMSQCSIRGLLSCIPALSTLLRASRASGVGSGPQNRSADPIPPLYFYPHSYEWIRHTLPKHWKADIRVWRAVDIDFTSRIIGDNLAGAMLLRIIYRLEEMFPHALARLGRYPMIIVQKAAG